MYFSTDIIFVFFLTRATVTMTFQNIFEKSDPESEIADFILAKGYLPNEKDMPKPSIIKTNENDETYLLSKLSDDAIIKLLNDQSPKTDFDVKDIIKIALDGNPRQNNLLLPRTERPFQQNEIKGEYKNLSPNTGESQTAYFRLDDKEVVPKLKNEVEFAALKKLKNLLHSVPQHDSNKNDFIDDAKKELLFDILVAQLKTLCCSKPKRQDVDINFKSSKFMKQKPYQSKSRLKPMISPKPSEFMFLIMNDEIQSKGSGELISVDPESLEGNSSVLLLGPITTPLSDEQLLSVMNKISNELSKPEYSTLLEQLSDGTLSENNRSLIKNFIYGPETRRYIKPHRCNHQSKLARIYGGPKWLICTGYININTPSLYDK